MIRKTHRNFLARPKSIIKTLLHRPIPIKKLSGFISR
uniref:Uncharacterized protein n=1 Tax=Schistosoma curassoni TaxID=6186 RepID=A0A183JR30_9TREM